MDIEQKLKLIKSTIQSLLVSSTRSMSVSVLQKDFYEQFGQNIPYKDFGYMSLMTFLESLPDVLKLHGNDSSALVIPVVSQNSAHIEKMMQKQKKNVTKRFQPRPKAIVEQKWKTVNNAQPLQPSSLRPQKSQISEHKPSIKNMKSGTEKRNGVSYSNVPVRKQFSSSEDFDNPNTKINNTKQYNNPEFQTKKDFSQISCENDIKFTTANKIEKSNDEILKDKLRNLISVYTDGIWCGQLPTLFKHKYNCDLDISKTGYPSISQYCASLPDVFQMIRPNQGDFLLFDARFPINEHKLEYEASSSTDSSVNYEKKEEALPAFEYEWARKKKPEHIPEVVVSDDEIPRQWIDGINDEFILVNVGQIYDPTVFWIILDSDKCSKALTKLMDDMQCFYATRHMFYQIPKDCIVEGLVCVSVILNEWHRGVIVHVIDDCYVKVFYMDYGSVEVISKSELRYLSNKFKYLPQQAIRARLSNIVPYRDTYWSQKACETFLELVINKSVYASSLEVDEENRVLNMVLIDTSGEDDVIINEYLCKNRLATGHFQNQEPKRSMIINFDHYEIECGNLPSLSERNLLFLKGFSFSDIIEICIKNTSVNSSYKFNVQDFHSADLEKVKQASLSENSDINFTEPIASSTGLENSNSNPSTPFDKNDSNVANVKTTNQDSKQVQGSAKKPPGFTAPCHNSDVFTKFCEQLVKQTPQTFCNLHPYLSNRPGNTVFVPSYPNFTQSYPQFDYQALLAYYNALSFANQLLLFPNNLLPNGNNLPTTLQEPKNNQNGLNQHLSSKSNDSINYSEVAKQFNNSNTVENQINNLQNSNVVQNKQLKSDKSAAQLKVKQTCSSNKKTEGKKQKTKTNISAGEEKLHTIGTQTNNQVCVSKNKKQKSKTKKLNKTENKDVLKSLEVSTQTHASQRSCDIQTDLLNEVESLNLESTTNEMDSNVSSTNKQNKCVKNVFPVPDIFQSQRLNPKLPQTDSGDLSLNASKSIVNNTNNKKKKNKKKNKKETNQCSADVQKCVLNNADFPSLNSSRSETPNNDHSIDLNIFSKCQNLQSNNLSQVRNKVDSNNLSLNVEKNPKKKKKLKQKTLTRKESEVDNIVSNNSKEGKDQENFKLAAVNVKPAIIDSSKQILEENAGKKFSYVLMKNIGNREVHVLRINSQLCIILNELLQFTKYDALDKIFIIFECQNLKCPSYTIDLSVHRELHDELKLYQIHGLPEDHAIINVINLTDIPYFLAFTYSKSDKVLTDINNIIQSEMVKIC